MGNIFWILLKLPQKAALTFISLYQKSVSPDHSLLGKALHPYGKCKFHPTCSQYSYEAISKYGLIKGGCKACHRICRCHPWSKGGHDPLI